MTQPLRRRQFILVGAGVALGIAACSRGEQSNPSATSAGTSAGTSEGRPSMTSQPGKQGNQGKTIVVFFSRAGENYFNGGRRNLEVGNTEVLATMIRDRIECDVYEIEAKEPYPQSYDETVQRNVDEQNDDARPTITRPLPDLKPYDTVLLGSPVWNVRAPMIMSTFIEGSDLAGKQVLPFVTYAVSGMGRVEDGYREALGDSEMGTGLAVRGETVADAGPQLDAWLRSHQLVR